VRRLLSLIILVGLGVGEASLASAQSQQRKQESHSLAYVQAMLAFAHYGALERIESLLARKCYDAALTEARWHKDAELRLLSENFAATGNDRELMEYIKLRDPKVMQVIMSGRLPDLRPVTTECP
jgi:hypothetical protein